MLIINVLTASTTNTTIYFTLRVVSAEFRTSRSEARHWRTRRKLPLLDSYLYNLPNSAKKFYNVTSIKDKRFQITKLLKIEYTRNSGFMRTYFFVYWLFGAFANLQKATI
jgi:hypothetical protein